MRHIVKGLLDTLLYLLCAPVSDEYSSLTTGFYLK